jgi:hypothetical protein
MRAFSLTMPAPLYDILTGPEAFADGTPQDVRARRVLQFAAPKTEGGVIRYRIIGGVYELRSILDRIRELPGPMPEIEMEPIELRKRPEREWTEVPHTETGELVGWLRKGEWRPVELGPPER